MADQRVLTSLRIPPELLKELKHRAVEEGVSLNSLLERGARLVLQSGAGWQPASLAKAPTSACSEQPRQPLEMALQPIPQELPMPDNEREPFAGIKSMLGFEDE